MVLSTNIVSISFESTVGQPHGISCVHRVGGQTATKTTNISPGKIDLTNPVSKIHFNPNALIKSYKKTNQV